MMSSRRNGHPTLQEQLSQRGFKSTPQYDFGPSKPAQVELEVKVRMYFPPNERIPDNVPTIIGSRLRTVGIRQLVKGVIRARHLPTTSNRWVELPCERESDARAVLEVLQDQQWPFGVTGEYRLWKN